MNELLRDAYSQYGENGFVLQKAVKNNKFSSNEGSLADRINEEWNDNATGYVGIIPPNIIIVDDDSYKDTSIDMFAELCDDLGLDYTPQPFALTPSGGKHYAFRSPNEDLVVGNLKDKYPNLDIYGGYQSVIPIVGTTVLNKQNVLATYEWFDELDGFYVNPVCLNMTEVLAMRERGVSNGSDFDDTGLDLATKNFDMSVEEVKDLIQRVPDDFEYDDWLKVGIALYERFEGNEQGLELFQAFGERCTREGINNPTNTESKWNSGHFKSDGRITYKTLRSLAREGNYSKFKTAIKTATSPKALEKVAKDISAEKYHNTTSKLTENVLDEYAELMNNQYKEIKKSHPTVKVIQARTLRKELDYEMSEEEREELVKEHGEIQVFNQGSRYVLRVNNTIVEDLTKPTTISNAIGLGVDKELIKELVEKPKTISDVTRIPDYTLETPVGFTIDKAFEKDRAEVLTIRSNPLSDVVDYIHDEEIIDDFCNKIWHGKAEDLLRIVALTVRFKETKLNKIMLVAPSNTGKTTFCEQADFQVIHMRRLLQSLNADKGIGQQVLSGLKASGFLLIDETNEALPQDIKNIDNYIYLDQFGSGGTQKIKLHFTVLTSTHKTATRTMSDELYNRMLQIELTEAEVPYPLTSSPVFLKDDTRYSEVLSGYFRWLLKDALSNKDYDKNTLKELQAKYRLELNTEVDDLMYDVSERVIDNLKGQATKHGDVIIWHDNYYVKRKKDLVGMIEDMLGENSQLDVGKYAEKLVNHFMPKSDRKGIKVDGKTVFYYAVNLKPYNPNASEEDKLKEGFVNLDLDEF